MSFSEWADGHPLAMSPEAVERLSAALDGDVGMLAARKGVPTDCKILSVHDGIAEIAIRGPISRYDSFWAWLLGGVSTESISRSVSLAGDDPSVKGIVLHVDSPGGHATGIGELATYIRRASASKPVVAYVEGYGASAAYYLASAATEVILSPSAVVGSIGVIAQYDPERKSGRKTIVSSQSPKKHLDPFTPEGEAGVRQTIDAIADVFIADVAKYRGVTTKKVIEDFGGGDVLVGKAAVDAGMADGISDFESVVASLRDTGSGMGSKGRVAGRKTERKPGMNFASVIARIFAKNPDVVNEALAAEAGNPTFIPTAAAKPEKTEAEIRAEVEASVRSEYEAKVQEQVVAARRAAENQAIEARVKAWVDGLVASGKATPAESNNLIAVGFDLSSADRDAPLSMVVGEAKSPISRFDTFKASVEARGSHGLTKTVVASARKDDEAFLLASASDKEANSDPDKQILVLRGLTELGRSTVK